MAGVPEGMSMAGLERLVRDAGRVPVQRDSLYNILERSKATAPA